MNKPTITRMVLSRLGYNKGKDCHFKRRICRRGTAVVLVQVRPVGGHWEYGKATICKVSAYECPVDPASCANFNQSEVSTVRELRDWERFAFCN